MIYKSVVDLVGNTPLILIDPKITGLKNIELYAKCELFNPFGSLKDRAGLAMFQQKLKNYMEENSIEYLEDIFKSGNIPTFIDSSSGNTAKALTILCQMNGFKFETVTNRIKQPEMRDVLKTLGADIEELPGFSECPDPSDPNNLLIYIDRKLLKKEKDYVYTDQYKNGANANMHYCTTGPEIYNDLGNVDIFFATLGTAGSSSGTMKYLKEKNNKMKKIGIVASSGDIIPGIRNLDEMGEVGLFNVKNYDEIIEVNSLEAIDQMLVLNKQCGILGGPTSGACMYGSLKYLKKLDEEISSKNDKENNEKLKAVFIACDRMENYMSYIRARRPEIYDSSKKTQSIFSLDQKDLEYAKELDFNQFNELLDKRNSGEIRNLVIVDLRGNIAYKMGHIDGSINIVDYMFEELLNFGEPFSKQSKVVLLCAKGQKSKAFSAMLNKKGYDVSSIKNGISELKLNGFKMIK